MPAPTLTPSAHLYEELVLREQTLTPLPWWVTALLVLTFALPFFFLHRSGRTSGVTRTGLWLVPWLPLLVVTWTTVIRYDPCPLEMGFGGVPLSCDILVWTLRLFGIAFVGGLLLLAFTSIRWLFKRRISAA
jgi:hypothetical protein